MEKQYSADNYYAVLEKMHAYLKPKTYVEIGVRHGESFALATTASHSVAIDPEPNIAMDLPSGAQIFKMTSDEFFNKHDLSTILNGQKLDLAFIDGMHLFEFALRDFLNLERFCNPNSVILVHDCYPIDEVTSNRERTTQTWSGDVWKLIVCLKKYRPELQICCIDVPPTGLAVIINLNNNSNIISDQFTKIYEEYTPFSFRNIAKNKPTHLNRIENDWSRIQYFLEGKKPNIVDRMIRNLLLKIA